MAQKISVVVPTMRCGGLDVTLDGLGKQGFRDFELVLVDKVWDRRHEDVERTAKKMGVENLQHVAPRKILDRISEPFSFCSYANTGLLYAHGELACFMADYTWVPPNWLDWYWRFHQKYPNDLACGHWWIIKPPKTAPGLDRPLSYLNIYSAAQGTQVLVNAITVFDGFYDGLFEVTIPDIRWVDPAPAAAEAWYTCNAAIPTQLAVDLNGFDEALDGALVYMDVDLAKRARMLGHGCWWLDNPVFELDHRLIEQDRQITKQHPVEDYLQQRWKRIEDGLASVKAQNSWNIADLRAKR